MKFATTIATAAVLLVGQASAWPIMVLKEMNERGISVDDAMRALTPDHVKRIGVPSLGNYPDDFGTPKPYTFDAKLQYVDLTGEHEFRAPGPDDERGPCAGLNALANHVGTICWQTFQAVC